MDLKKVMYALIAVAVLLAGALAYIWWSKSSLVKELNVEKEELTSQMIALQNDYASLSSDYDMINSHPIKACVHTAIYGIISVFKPERNTTFKQLFFK